MKKKSFWNCTLTAAATMTVLLSSAVIHHPVLAAETKSVILLQPTEECTYCADYVRFFKKEADAVGLKFV